MAREYIAVSAMGTDRVGLADDIASWIADAGGNVEESRMTVLGGEFAAIMLVSGSEAAAKTLVQGASKQADALDIRLDSAKTAAPRSDPKGRICTVESVSLDSPGIVHALTREMRMLGISVEDLETSSSPAPWTGAPVFRMKARVTLPADLSLDKFRDCLDELGHRRDMEIQLDPV